MKNTWALLNTLWLLGLSFASQAWTVRYQHTDLQGSVIAESNTQGSIQQRYDYKPYGEGTPSQKSGLGYTGHLEDPDLGLTYMQQRFYDPVIGRFYSNDPVGFTTQTPVTFSRYAYANNNPYKFTDPDGMCSKAPNAAARDICQNAKSLNTSTKGKNHIKKFENEGYAKKKVHYDGAGNPTAGYGHKVKPSENMELDQDVSESTADQLLDTDVDNAEQVVERLVGDLEVSQNEFDALSDLAYNVGEGTLSAENSPGLNKAIENKDYSAIKDNLRYTKANGVQLPGLVDRSNARQNLYSGSEE